MQYDEWKLSLPFQLYFPFWSLLYFLFVFFLFSFFILMSSLLHGFLTIGFLLESGSWTFVDGEILIMLFFLVDVNIECVVVWWKFQRWVFCHLLSGMDGHYNGFFVCVVCIGFVFTLLGANCVFICFLFFLYSWLTFTHNLHKQLGHSLWFLFLYYFYIFSLFFFFLKIL